jgi:hypothetical protein|uniref:Uncharacterized protein n=1 Tax=viral metagenome TaxID=1070528 RepID=A0A6C0IP38_9ZZZZ
MPTKTYTETTALVCDDNVCYNLQDILRNPDNKCDKDSCKKVERDYADFMHLSLPVGYFHASAMHNPLPNYEERVPRQVAVIIEEKKYTQLIEPSLEEEPKKKNVTSNKKTKKSDKKKSSNKKTTKKRKKK